MTTEILENDTLSKKEDLFVNKAVDFFALIGTGEVLQVDDDSGSFTPEYLHEVNSSLYY